MESEQQEELVWFAMRATYRREMIAKRALEDRSIESFVPMRYELKLQGGRRRRVLVPAIHNLIFVHAAPKHLQQVKTHLPYLQYMIRKGGEKILVPDEQMRRFIAVTEDLDEGLTYYNPEELRLEKGQRVKIHGGPCDEQEGVLVKVPGFRSRRVVVAIEGVMAVALATVKPEQLEVL
ncbi:MAG: UpxY family transcription antiterminator [Rikenellaceae bacterium]|nr:UpxY family transcription antiterminator [Rikenellaceae bacterium]